MRCSQTFDRMFVGFAALALLVATGCEPPPPPEEQPDEVEMELQGDAQAGAQVYDAQCAECHGPQGEGDGPLAETLDPAPRALTEVELDAEHVRTITRDGGEAVGMSPVMPAFDAVLDDDEIEDVTAYVMQLGQDNPAGQEQPAQQDAPSQQDEPAQQEPGEE